MLIKIKAQALASANSGKGIQIIWVHQGNVSNWKCTCFSIILYQPDFECQLFQGARTSLVYSDFVKKLMEVMIRSAKRNQFWELYLKLNASTLITSERNLKSKC